MTEDDEIVIQCPKCFQKYVIPDVSELAVEKHFANHGLKPPSGVWFLDWVKAGGHKEANK